MFGVKKKEEEEVKTVVQTKKKHESRKIKEKKGKPTEESHVQLLPVVIDVGENVERS